MPDEIAPRRRPRIVDAPTDQIGTFETEEFLPEAAPVIEEPVAAEPRRRRIVEQTFSEEAMEPPPKAEPEVVKPKRVPKTRAPKEDAPKERVVKEYDPDARSSLDPLKRERPVVVPFLDQMLLNSNDFQSLREAARDGLFYVKELEDYITPEMARSEIESIVDRIAKNEEAYLDVGRDQLQMIVFNAMRTRGKELLIQFESAEAPEMRVRKRKQMLLEKAQIAQEEAEIEATAKEELKIVLDTLAQSDSLSETQKFTLKYFSLIYVDGKKDPEIAEQFPKSTRDQRYQWKARGIQMVLPHVSDTTKRYLEWRAKRKFVTASDIFAYSKYFLSKIGELQ